MHPYSYNRLRLDSPSQTPHGSESPDPPQGHAPENNNTDGTGSSPDLAQLMAMMEALRGGKTDGGEAGLPPDFTKLMPMIQAMLGGASGSNGMQSMLPLLSALGGASGGNGMQNILPLLSALGGASGGNWMQNILPLLSALGGGGGLPPNMKSAPESASGGANGANGNASMLNLLQGMMPPQTAQLFNMLSSFRS